LAGWGRKERFIPAFTEENNIDVWLRRNVMVQNQKTDDEKQRFLRTIKKRGRKK